MFKIKSTPPRKGAVPPDGFGESREMPLPALPTPPGQRERNKLDKLRRIKDAARELFVAKGFDDTTTREIALRAGVGIGTIFVYAENKRDLLFLIANEELEKVTERAEAAVNESTSL